MVVVCGGLAFCNELSLTQPRSGGTSVRLQNHHFDFSTADVVAPIRSSLGAHSASLRTGADVK